MVPPGDLPTSREAPRLTPRNPVSLDHDRWEGRPGADPGRPTHHKTKRPGRRQAGPGRSRSDEAQARSKVTSSSLTASRTGRGAFPDWTKTDSSSDFEARSWKSLTAVSVWIFLSRITLVITSPSLSPSASAEEPSLTLLTSRPLTSAGRSSFLARSGVIGWTSRPKSLIGVLAGTCSPPDGFSWPCSRSMSKTTFSAGAGVMVVDLRLPSR